MKKSMAYLLLIVFAFGFSAVFSEVSFGQSINVPFNQQDVCFSTDALGQKGYIPFEDYYDSGLQPISAGSSLTFLHNLGPDPSIYLVFVYGYNSHGYHHANYGTTAFYYLGIKWAGLEWQQLNSTSITVYRAPDDDHWSIPSEKRWDMVRVFIIKPGITAPPRGLHYLDHEVALIPMGPGDETTYIHNLGGDPGRYMIYVYGYNSKGVHQANYGTNAIQFIPSEKWVGAEWQELTPNSIKLIRTENDDEAGLSKTWDTFVLIMLKVDVDSYDPPYIPLNNAYLSKPGINPGQELSLYHGLGGMPLWYMVHVYGYNSNGYHQANYGTNSYDIPLKWCGLEWYEMGPNTIKLLRAIDDTNPPIPPEKLWDYVNVLMVRVF